MEIKNRYQSKTIEGLKNFMSPPFVDPVSTFNLVFEYEPIAPEILTQPSRYKRAESNLLADEKCPQR